MDELDLAARKADARRAGRDARRALPAEVRAAMGAAIRDRVVRLVAEVGARTVATYCATGPEVDLDPLVAPWLAAGVVVAAPRVDAPRQMAFHRLEALPAAAEPPFGIRQPPAGAPIIARPDVVLVPGVAFDVRGGRVGRGAGYYDRWLAACPPPRPVVVGVAFEAQLVDDVPREAHDVDVDAVVTEAAVYR